MAAGEAGLSTGTRWGPGRCCRARRHRPRDPHGRMGGRVGRCRRVLHSVRVPHHDTATRGTRPDWWGGARFVLEAAGSAAAAGARPAPGRVVRGGTSARAGDRRGVVRIELCAARRVGRDRDRPPLVVGGGGALLCALAAAVCRGATEPAADRRRSLRRAARVARGCLADRPRPGLLRDRHAGRGDPRRVPPRLLGTAARAAEVAAVGAPGVDRSGRRTVGMGHPGAVVRAGNVRRSGVDRVGDDLDATPAGHPVGDGVLRGVHVALPDHRMGRGHDPRGVGRRLRVHQRGCRRVVASRATVDSQARLRRPESPGCGTRPAT